MNVIFYGGALAFKVYLYLIILLNCGQEKDKVSPAKHLEITGKLVKWARILNAQRAGILRPIDWALRKEVGDLGGLFTLCQNSVFEHKGAL